MPRPEIVPAFLPVQCYASKKNHYQPRKLMVQGVVQHYFSGKYAFPHKPYDAEKCWQLMHDLNMQPGHRLYDVYADENPRVPVSAHYMIDRQGTIMQLVPLEFQSWHAGRSKWAGVSSCNGFMVGIENIGMHDLPYTDQQYSANGRLCAWLMQQYGFGLDMITGHENVSPGRKKDPGPSFNWDLLHSIIKIHS